MNPADEIFSMLKKVEAGVDEMGRVLNATLAWIPDGMSWVIDAVDEAWNALMAKLAEFWNWFTDKLAYVGNPFALSAAAATWRSDVGAIATNLNRDVDDSDLQVDDAWQGAGANKYRQAVEPQREALMSLANDFASNIANGLDALRNALIGFWTAVLAAIVGLVAGIAVGVGAAATVVGAPASPVPVLAGVAIALAALVGAVLILSNGANDAKGDFDTAEAGVDSWPAFVTS